MSKIKGIQSTIKVGKDNQLRSHCMANTKLHLNARTNLLRSHLSRSWTSISRWTPRSNSTKGPKACPNNKRDLLKGTIKHWVVQLLTIFLKNRRNPQWGLSRRTWVWSSPSLHLVMFLNLVSGNLLWEGMSAPIIIQWLSKHSMISSRKPVA